MNKASELIAWADNNCYDITAITETWLDDSILDSELLPSNYIMERCGCNRHGGGVLLGCRDNLALVRCEDLESLVEILWCKIHMGGVKCALFGVYYCLQLTYEKV